MPYPLGAIVPPWGRPGDKHRAVRGGGYNNTASHCCRGVRNGNVPNNFNNNNGFRLVVELAGCLHRWLMLLDQKWWAPRRVTRDLTGHSGAP